MFQASRVVDDEVWYIKHRELLKQERNPLIREVLARTDTNMFKAALLHAAIKNDAGNHEIGVESLRWAIMLAEYLQTVTTGIYSDFNLSETRRLEQRIMDLLTQQSNQTVRELAKGISTANTAEVKAVCDELCMSGEICVSEETARTTRFSLAVGT